MTDTAGDQQDRRQGETEAAPDPPPAPRRSWGSRLPIHLARQLVLGGLVAILLAVVVVAYQHSLASMQALRSNMEVVAPAHAHLQSISSLLTISGHAFQIYAGRERVDSAEVVIPLTRLATSLRTLYRRLRAADRVQGLPPPPTDAARAALQELLEARNQPDSQAAVERLLRRVQQQVGATRDWFREALQRAQAAGLELDRSQLRKHSNLLNSVALALERFAVGEGPQFESVLGPVERTLNILNDLPPVDRFARMPGAVVADGEALSEEVEALSSALLRYRAALLAYRDVERMQMAGTSTTEARISVLETYAEADSQVQSVLDRLNQLFVAIQARTLHQQNVSRNVLLVLGSAGVLLSILISFGLGRLLKGRISHLLRGARRLAAGRLDARLESPARDDLGRLAETFNTMAEALQQKDIALEGRIRELDAANRHIREINADLERRVERRTRELREASAEAQAANLAKSQFLATMSHEIRTPMNGLLGMTELLLATDLTPKQRRFLDTIRRSGETLLSLINDILDFSKIESGRLELDTAPFSLRELVEDIGELFAPRAHAMGLELACDLPPEFHERVQGDAGRLRQVLVNLVGNAIKFTPRGEVVVGLVVESEFSSQQRVRLYVRDTGIGIAPAQQERIFDSFSQADSSTSRMYGGTGLGLAISRRLVELMGGHLDVMSRLGEGSLFRFSIVLAKETEAAPEGPAARSLPKAARVMVVDDNATNREILDHQLQAWGLEPHSLADGNDALAALRTAAAAGRHYDLLVLDLHMPDTDGLQVAEAVRAEEVLEGLPIILLSSADLEEEREACRALGINHRLTKPPRRADLLEAVLESLRGPGQLPALPPADATLASEAPGASRPAPYAERPTAEAAARRPPLLSGRVLLAEDNRVNQEYAMALLEDLGVMTDLAVDGREALRKLELNDYDLVLMDCQMPEMDGFEATAEIRRREAESGGPRLPVLALTANALSGDRTRCIEAGMDDYLPKPFDALQLRSLLSRWMRPGAGAPVAQAPPSRTPAPDLEGIEALDAAGVEALRRLSGDPRFFQRLVSTYLSRSVEDIERLRAARDAGDVEGLRRAAHSLKSSSYNVKAVPLAEACRELETQARSGSLADPDAWVARVEAEYQRAVAALRQASGKAVADG